MKNLWAKTRRQVRRMLVRVRKHVPPGFRLLLGLLLIAGGFLGFLPILGFWMIPLGISVAMLDIRPIVLWVQNSRSQS